MYSIHIGTIRLADGFLFIQKNIRFIRSGHLNSIWIRTELSFQKTQRA